jgi:5'(3')-deoxyribonucleotidase
LGPFWEEKSHPFWSGRMAGWGLLPHLFQPKWPIFRCLVRPLTQYYEHCVLEKYQWVESNFGRNWTDRLVLTRDKTIIQGDILIDDRPDIVGAVKNPHWEHVIFEQPYNTHVTGKRRLTWSTWKKTLLL